MRFGLFLLAGLLLTGCERFEEKKRDGSRKALGLGWFDA